MHKINIYLQKNAYFCNQKSENLSILDMTFFPYPWAQFNFFLEMHQFQTRRVYLFHFIIYGTVIYCLQLLLYSKSWTERKNHYYPFSKLSSTGPELLCKGTRIRDKPRGLSLVTLKMEYNYCKMRWCEKTVVYPARCLTTQSPEHAAKVCLALNLNPGLNLTCFIR